MLRQREGEERERGRGEGVHSSRRKRKEKRRRRRIGSGGGGGPAGLGARPPAWDARHRRRARAALGRAAGFLWPETEDEIGRERTMEKE